MDDAVRSGGALLETVRIRNRSAIDVGAGSRKPRRLVIRTAETNYLMARSDQFLHDSRTDISSGASYKHTHEQNLQVSLETNVGPSVILVK